MKQLRTMTIVAGLCAFAFSAVAAPVSQETALAAAEGFLARSSVAQRILAGRSVKDVEARGNLWIVNLEPSGYIEIAGSTKCAPIAFFSTHDFVEPEVGSPFAAKLTGDSMMVAEKEADESATDNADWAKYIATISKKRALLKSAPPGTTGVVGPLMNCGWGQGAPFNDLSPLSSLCGCMATAAGQEHRYWRWPYRYEKSRQGTHGLRNSLGEYSNHVMRPDGRVPFNYDKVVAYAPNPASTSLATDKEATYQTAFLSLWMQSLTGMSYKPGASGGTQKLCNFAEQYWFEAGPVMSYWRDGYTNLWNAIRADLDFGSPIQVNSPRHQMVVDGYAIDKEGAADEAHYININYGWGSPEGWVNLLTAVTESTSGGRLADFQIGYRPQKIVQFEPVPRVSTSNVTLTWHLPPCYTNRTTGFTIEIAKAGGATTMDAVATHGETTTYTATGLDVGGSYTFTVTPLMSDGSEARSNIAVTTIGTPKAAPEIVSVSSIACGIDLVQQGFYIECGRGVTNTIDVACSTSVTSLDAYSSHLTVLPDNKVSTVNNGNGSWTINVDATSMAKDWDGDMLVLTLVAKNDDETETAKNLMLRFNSMRQELGGSYDIVETAANNAVWFCGTTTLDAKGQDVTFGAGAFCGTGTITLADTTGGGSFTFQGLDNFTGTLKWAPSVTVNLPADMSNFRGTLYFNSSAEDYTLSSDLPSTAKIFIAGNTQLTPGDVTIDAAVSGGGVINITGVNATFNNLTDFTGSISLGTFESAGTLTLKAGEERNVEIWNGTLYLTLDKAQVAYGYTTSQIKDLESFFGAKLVFQDENGKTLKTWTSSLSEYTLESSANTWFPDVSSGTGNFWDEDRWSQGLPSAGDYVIFNDTFGDTTMTLNLPSDFNLGYVKVVGTKFNIEAADGTSKLSVDTLKNEIPTKLSTTQFEPEVVIPRDKLFVSPGFTISCDIDHSLAGNLRDISDVFSALTYGNEYGDRYCVWRGTVVFSDYVAAGLDLREWGHSNSLVRLNGVTGYLKANTEFPYPVELVDKGETSALNWSNGSSGAQSTFDILTGTGTFQTTGGGGNTEKVLIKDLSGFTGSFNLAAKNVAIADAMPEDATASNGRLYVEKDVEISSGKVWAANGGLYLGAGADLTVSGAFATGSAINTYGEGTVLTLEDGGSVKVNGAISGDNAPTLNFKAGTYQITRNLTDTKTVNFCAAAGKYTTLDANGNTFTLGANFFSGSGDVYLKTSASGGAFVIQGIPAAYTGTIYVDNSIGLTISGDLSQMGGKINISDITLSRNSSNIGKIDVCSGATLQVVLTDREAMSGFSPSGVTLSGGTIEYVDQRGTIITTSTESVGYTRPGDYSVPEPEPEPEYEGPAPVAVWVAGEFGDDRSAHGGLEISLNGNTTNALGQIVIGDDVATGATIKLPDDAFAKASILVRYELASEGAPVANAAPIGVISTDGYPIVPICTTEGGTILKGAYLNKDNAYALVNNSGNYWPFSVAPTISNGEGYMLLSYHSELANPMSHGTAVYVGSSVNTLAGGNASSLQWKTKTIDKIAIGGPTTAGGANPWKGMVIKGVALFADEWLTPTDLANYKFPEQGAVLSEDSDLYAIEPVAKWVNDFKTTEKNGCTLSVSGTTAAKDDTFGGTLTIGDAAAIIDTTAASSTKMTVLIKYRVASNVTNAPVVAFGGMATATVGLDVGVYTKLDTTLAVYRNFSTDNGKPYDFETAPQLSATGGYVLCARNNTNLCMAYVGDSLDSMTGGEVANSNILFSNVTLTKLGIGGNSGMAANANDMVPFAGLEIEKIVVFDDYYTPDQIRYIPNPEEGDTLSIADGATWNFAAGTTRTYTNIGTLSAGGTIAVTNASELSEGYYTLATWTTAQKYTTRCAGYGKVGTLVTDGLADGLSARLVYGAKAIYLRVDNVATQEARKPIVILPYGDSITEGFTAEHTGANYRILLYQKLELLGFKVKSVGIYDKDDGYDSVDPCGDALSNDYKWHSAKHGAVTGRSTATASGRGDLEENVDTVCAQAGKPDAVLLHIGINDLVSSDRVSLAKMSEPVFASWTNVVWRLVNDLPDAKIIVSTVLYGAKGQKTRKIGSEEILLPDLIDDFNDRIKAYMDAFPAGRVYLADLNACVKSDDYGIIYKDNIHPDWWGHDQMAEGWLSVITNQFSASQDFSSATPIVAPADNELGAAAKDELADYIAGFKRYAVVEPCKNILPTLESAIPYSQVDSEAATNDIEKVGYFVEYVRSDNNVHKWVWVDMDAFGTTIEDVGLPKAKHQHVVTGLHVKSNHGAIDDVPVDDDSVTGFVEFSPFDYAPASSGVEGAPKDYASRCDWNDTLSESGSKSCMQVHRTLSSTSAPGGQVLFAYNNWRSESSEAEFGIGNFSQHFHGGSQTFDYSETTGLATMNASAYSVKRIEIWTKAAEGEKATDTDFPTPYSWIDMYFPELVSGWGPTQYNDFATNKNHSSVKNGYAPWESYLLGLEPTNATSKFTATIRMDGLRPVVEFSPTNETLRATGAITYVLQGKPTLTNEWGICPSFDEPGDTNRFFRVKVQWTN